MHHFPLLGWHYAALLHMTGLVACYGMCIYCACGVTRVASPPREVTVVQSAETVYSEADLKPVPLPLPLVL